MCGIILPGPHLHLDCSVRTPAAPTGARLTQLEVLILSRTAQRYLGFPASHFFLTPHFLRREVAEATQPRTPRDGSASGILQYVRIWSRNHQTHGLFVIAVLAFRAVLTYPWRYGRME